jgi:hypothetical protein
MRWTDETLMPAASAIAASVQLGVSAILWNLDATMLKPDCSTQKSCPNPEVLYFYQQNV